VLQSQNIDKALIAQYNEELTGSNPREILVWAIRAFKPDLTLACSYGGVSGMVLLDILSKVDNTVPVFFLDTDFLFPETYALKEKATRRYGFIPVSFKASISPAQQTEQFGEALWQRDPDLCCAIRKVEPTRQALDGKRAWITGLRRDQSKTRRLVKPLEWDEKFGLFKISPLWNWQEEQVWEYLVENKVPYNTLHDQGYPSLGCTHCTRPVTTGENSRDGRWSGFEKTECGLHR
jgi:phosphoadenosine phosphosulfate reductase